MANFGIADTPFEVHLLIGSDISERPNTFFGADNTLGGNQTVS